MTDEWHRSANIGLPSTRLLKALADSSQPKLPEPSAQTEEPEKETPGDDANRRRAREKRTRTTEMPGRGGAAPRYFPAMEMYNRVTYEPLRSRRR